MGTLSTGDVSDYLTASTVPMPTTTTNTTAAGQVVSVVITSGGAGFTTTPTVTVTGDGTNLTLGTPVLVGGVLTHIPVSYGGQNYTYVNITITGGTTTATARAIIAPVGGFGNDLVTEIEPNYMVVKSTNINTDQYFVTQGNAPTTYSTTGVQGLTYRTVGLIENPTVAGTAPYANFTEYRYSNISGTIVYGDLLGQPKSYATVVGIRQDTSAIADVVTINAATAVNNSTHVITAIGHGLVTGDSVLYSNGGGTSIGALTNNNTYYVIKLDNDNFKVSSTLNNALTNVSLPVTVGIGSSQTFTENVVKNYVSLAQTTEQLVNYFNVGSTLTKTDGTASISLGPLIKFNGSSAGVVGVGTDVITISGHPFATGDMVTYTAGQSGNEIGSTGNLLVDSQTYYIIRVSSNEIKLATSLANANSNIAIDFTYLGIGSNHGLMYTGSDVVTLPETTKYTGNIIFTEYRNAVTRSTSQEKFRFVLEF